MKKTNVLLATLISTLVVGCNDTSSSDINSSSNNSSSIVSSSSSSEYVKAKYKTIVDHDIAEIWGAPNTVCIMQDVDIDAQCEFWGTEWLEHTDKLAMKGLKGETESTQLMITAKKDINAFMFTLGELVNQDDQTAKIAADNVNIYAERYIEVLASSSTPKKACAFAGFYPDALVPINKYKARKENVIKNGNYQGIFITVDVPADTKAGTYIAKGNLTLDGQIIEVPISLKVYNATVPEEVHRRTALDIWGDQIGYGEVMVDEDNNAIDWYQIYYDYVVSKRITPQKIGLTTIGDGYAAEVVEAARNPRITGYRLPYGEASVQGIDARVVHYGSLVTLLTALANKNIELRQGGDTTTDLFKKAYYYFAATIDEPTGSKFDAVKYCDDAVTRAKEEVAELLNDYPDLKDSCLKVPHVVTTRYNDSLSGYVQTWCSQVQAYSADVLSKIEERENSTELYYNGEGFWNYMTCDSNNPYPSMQLDDNLMSTRILSWMDFDYDIQCTLFWNANYYQAYDYQSGNMLRDIWSNPKTWGSANGDGYLLYPGSRYGLDTPIATLRLENFREATEDYEYLYLLREGINNIATTKGEDIDYKEFLRKYFDKLYKHNSMVPTTNIETFSEVRDEILELVELITNDPEEFYKLIKK